MPRNRKTKGRGTSGVHAKAVVPDGDEGQQLESELKAEKIKTMISDFDMEGIECIFLSGFPFDVSDSYGFQCCYIVSFLVARRVKDMKKEIPILLNKLKVLYSVEILKIPKVSSNT